MTSLVWWEFILLAICWPICLLYLFYILFMMVKKFGIPITVREQLRLNGVMNVSLFLHTELVLRPIAYEWFCPITALPPWFPRVLYATQAILKNNIYLIYIPSAINRFTAFYYPVKHQHIWSCMRFRALFFLVWTISTIFALPSILSNSAQFIRIREGVSLDLVAYDELIGETLSFVLSLAAVIVTTLLSIACLLKYRSMHFRVNRNLYECQLFLTSLTAYPPFLIYTIKCVLELVSSFTGNESMKQTYLITWYWLLDIQTLLPLIPILICTGFFKSITSRVKHLLASEPSDGISPITSPAPPPSTTQSGRPTSSTQVQCTIPEVETVSRKSSGNSLHPTFELAAHNSTV